MHGVIATTMTSLDQNLLRDSAEGRFNHAVDGNAVTRRGSHHQHWRQIGALEIAGNDTMQAELNKIAKR